MESGENRKGHNSKNRGSGGVGFLVKEFLCDIIEVIEDTTFDDTNTVKGARGEGSEMFFLRKHLHAPRVEGCGKGDT